MVDKIDLIAALDDIAERKKAYEAAIHIVETVVWPWTERQKHLWYIGVLAKYTSYPLSVLENASIEELQELHREITH